MTQSPLISIVIPTYNSEGFIAKALESAVKQTYPSIEIVVVDNASEDNTLSIARDYAKRYGNIRISQNDENVGPVNNWRRGMELASGDKVCLLFSDDWYEPEFVSLAAPKLEDSDVAFVYSHVRSVSQDGSANGVLYRSFHGGEWPIEKLIEAHMYFETDGVPLSPCCGMFRLCDIRDALSVSLPNEEKMGFMRHGAGPDMLVYLLTAIKYSKFSVIESTLVNFLGHEGNLSRERRVNLSYAMAKAWFVSECRDSLPFLDTNRFKAAHLWRLLRCHGLKNYFLSLTPKMSPWIISWPALIGYVLKRIFSRLKRT